MDVLLLPLVGMRRWEMAERQLLRLDRSIQWSNSPAMSRTEKEGTMVLYLFWIVTLTAPLIALALSAGCAPLPRKASETRFVADANDATAAALPHEVAGEFWKREHSREIKFERGGIVSIIESAGPLDEELTVARRVAITEFIVEFVDVQIENPFGHPTTIKSSSAPTRAVEPGTQGSGAQAQQSPMSTASQIQISTALRDVFERHLRQNGLIIVPQPDDTSSARHANLKPRPLVSSPWAPFLKPVTSDTGITLRMHTVAAPGAGVATSGRAVLAATGTEVKRETEADVAMAVKLRVGIFDQRAALEQNSSIRLMTADRSIILTAQKSLVSESNVTDDSRLIRFAGRIERAHEEQFACQLEAILPEFIGLAFPSLPGKMRHDDPFARVASASSP
jgi:hypothetical protein